MVQAVGLPALLVVFPVHVFKYLRSKVQHTTLVAAPASPNLHVLVSVGT
jgi:hypothetical protein